MNKLFVFFQQSSFIDINGKCYAYSYDIVFQDNNEEYLYPISSAEELFRYSDEEELLKLIKSTPNLNDKFWQVVEDFGGYFFGPAKKWYALSAISVI